MSRNECKFLLNYDQHRLLKNRFDLLFRQDRYAQKGLKAYPVLSAYFDTSDLDFFYQKINGEFDHTKIRLRTYDRKFTAGAKVFLEAKLKWADQQEKVRISLDFEKNLLNPLKWYYLGRDKVMKLLQFFGDLEHICNVYYERQAFEGMFETGMVRLNFDSNLLVLPKDQIGVEPGSLAEHRIIPHDHVVCEVKTDLGIMPEIIKEELRLVGASQTRISKYAESLLRMDRDGLYPEVSV